jgi:predicted ThiF/HesA family dinucleotide-utilizing enzyme
MKVGLVGVGRLGAACALSLVVHGSAHRSVPRSLYAMATTRISLVPTS